RATVRCRRSAAVALLAGVAAFFSRGAAPPARPRLDSFRRCTLPMTALRLTPPSCAAIWLALRPSAQSFFSSSTRSSVQFIAKRSCKGARGIRTPAPTGLPRWAPHLHGYVGPPHEIGRAPCRAREEG